MFGSRKHGINCMGDSLTRNRTTGVMPWKLWPVQLQAKLRNTGASVAVRNFGVSGNTTAQMVERFACMTDRGIPDIAIIFGGANDRGNGISQVTTQANIETMIGAMKGAGCPKVIVVSAHLLNYTSDSDIPDVIAGVPKTDDTCYYATVITAQKAAAESTGAVYCDLYNYLRDRIVSGQDAKHSASWHVGPQNQHFNAYGMGLVASKVYATIVTQGWDAALI